MFNSFDINMMVKSDAKEFFFKSLGPFRIYQLIWPYVSKIGLDWMCCLAGKSKTALTIFEFFNC
jgi:hypothetical protein